MDEFWRWYIGLLLIGMGCASAIGRSYLANTARFFKLCRYDDATADRIRRVLDERKAIEGVPARAWLISGVLAAALGVATLLRVVQPSLGFGLMCFAFALGLGFAYVQMRNVGPKRAAALVPRTIATAVPAVWYVCAAVVSALPLLYATTPVYRLSAVLISLSAFTTLGATVAISQMPAILRGADVEVELYVDESLRRLRIGQAYFLVPCQAFIFLNIVHPHTWYQASALLVVSVLWGCVWFSSLRKSLWRPRDFIAA